MVIGQNVNTTNSQNKRQAAKNGEMGGSVEEHRKGQSRSFTAEPALTVCN